MPDYPGVDPDGLIPGGLQIAGKVNAGALAVLGQAITPSVFGWGTWSGDSGANVPHGTSALLTFDSEDKALAEVTFSNPDTKVTFNTAGTYLVFGMAFQNAGGAASGYVGAIFNVSAGTHWRFSNNIPFDSIDVGNVLVMEICDVPAGATLNLNLNNQLNIDMVLGGEIMIMRLA